MNFTTRTTPWLIAATVVAGHCGLAGAESLSRDWPQVPAVAIAQDAAEAPPMRVGYSTTARSLGPLAYWRFEPDSHHATHERPSDPALLPLPMRCADQVVESRPGLGMAVSLADTRGVGGNEEIISDPSRLALRDSMTVAWWQNVPEYSALAAVFSWSGPGEEAAVNALYEFGTDAAGHLRYVHEFGPGDHVEFKSPGPLPANKWTHVVVVRDTAAKTVTFYVDGQRFGEPMGYAANPTGGEAGAPGIGTLGGHGNTWPFRGKLDELAIFDRALSLQEVERLFRAAPPYVNYKTVHQENRDQQIVCEGGHAYPKHLQGIAVDQTSIYWSYTTELVKTDHDGRVLRKIKVPMHAGDLTVANGKVYVAVEFAPFDNDHGPKQSVIYVYDAQTLAELDRVPLPYVRLAICGMGYHDGRFMLVFDALKGSGINYLVETDMNFRPLREVQIEMVPTFAGVQAIDFHEGSWWLGCYSSVLACVSEDFKKVELFTNCDFGVGVARWRPGMLLRAETSIDDRYRWEGRAYPVVKPQIERMDQP